jgi:hypothetical protein
MPQVPLIAPRCYCTTPLGRRPFPHSLFPCLPPSPAHKHTPATTILVTMRHETHSRVRRTLPTSSFPAPATPTPSPCAADPDISRPRRHRHRLGIRRRRLRIGIDYARFGRDYRLASWPPHSHRASRSQDRADGEHNSEFYQTGFFHPEKIKPRRPKSQLSNIQESASIYPRPFGGCPRF